MTEHITTSETDTIKIATEFAATLKAGDVVALFGDLGMGKSVFCRAVIRALSGDPEMLVPSPTFTLVQTYDTSRGEAWHFDLYRLEHPEEIYELGWEDALADGITLIEWPDKAGALLPPDVIKIEITSQSDTVRDIKIGKSL